MDSNKIGTINDDNSIDWPKMDVLGGAVSIPATRHALTDKTFVVLPAGFNQWEWLEELKAGSKNRITEWRGGEVPNAAVTGLEAPQTEHWEDTTFTGGEDVAADTKKGKK